MKTLRKHIRSCSGRTFSGMTMPELLVVMVVSGIVFLLLFDGLNLVQRYGRILDRRMSEKASLVYSHIALESLMEKSDSICLNANTLFFYLSNAPIIRSIDMDSTCLLLREEEHTDTLFRGLINVEFYTATITPSLVDSLSITMCLGGDTLRLDYVLE